ncbi:MAG TPA: glycosyltransferase family 4 protein [Verrucomicrobiae bacterium]
MKILYLCPDLGVPVLGRKGAAVHVRELAAALVRAGHEVVLAAQMLNKSPWEKAAEAPCPVLQVRPSLNAGAAVLGLKEFNEALGIENSLPGELRRLLYNKELEAEITRRFESNPPDLIYERASLYATAGVTLARGFKVPHLLELNAPLAVEQSAYRATGFGELAATSERWTLTHADAVLAVSALLKEHAISAGAAAEKVWLVPNGVNTELFHPGPSDPQLRARFNLDGGPVLGFVGGLRPWHGVESLPELVQRLAAKHAGVRLVIGGDGPLRKRLEEELAQRGVRSRVFITGLLPHEEIPSVVRLFDVAVAPYPAPEHAFYFSPLKLFEYMGCGIPVVAPRLGQIAEVVRDGENGLLYPAGDLESLAAGCSRLFEEPRLRRELGAQAAKTISDGFTWDHNAARVAEIYGRLRPARP